MNCRFPDYENCGLNLISSVSRYFGAPARHKTLPFMDQLLCRKQYRNVVLILLDGMGMQILQDNAPADSFFNTHIVRELSSVYPSTTTAATTSIETDYSPAEHGWIGWSLYFSEIGKTVDVFTNRDSDDGTPAAAYPVGDTYMPLHPVFERISACGKAKAAIVSPFSEPAVPTLEGIFDVIAEGCGEPGRHFYYGYWSEPDHTMHEVGVRTEAVRDLIADLEEKVRDLAARLPDDTLLLVTADHGQVNAKHLFITDHPELAEALEHSAAVEPRTTVFYVKPAYRDRFPALFRAAFPDGFVLMTGEEFRLSGILGPGEQHEKLPSLTGDYVAIALTEACIDNRPKDFMLTGVHAGMTRAETRVPLIMAKG